MFSQSQDGRQAVPAMHMQSGVQQNMTPQMQTMQVQMNPGQQTMSGMPGAGGMPQQPGAGGMQRSLGAIGQQHSLTGTGMSHQVDMSGGARPMNTGAQQNLTIKTEVGSAVQVGATGMVQRMPAPVPQPALQQPKQEGQTTSSQQAQQFDRIVKFKQLLPQLKDALQNLIGLARQNFAANATIDNLEKSVDSSLIERFDRSLEQILSICNLIERDLMTAYDQISHTLYSMQYNPMTANQMRDGTNSTAYTTYILTVQQQLAYTKEIQNMLTESFNKYLARQTAHQQQQPTQTLQQRQLF